MDWAGDSRACSGRARVPPGACAEASPLSATQNSRGNRRPGAERQRSVAFQSTTARTIRTDRATPSAPPPGPRASTPAASAHTLCGAGCAAPARSAASDTEFAAARGSAAGSGHRTPRSSRKHGRRAARGGELFRPRSRPPLRHEPRHQPAQNQNLRQELVRGHAATSRASAAFTAFAMARPIGSGTPLPTTRCIPCVVNGASVPILSIHSADRP